MQKLFARKFLSEILEDESEKCLSEIVFPKVFYVNV